ncbi:MAG: sugar phosphate isomerase/epimerase family protein [Bacteroidia bacterium]|nr:sugar phosphate isomerase/epimerase family protein [Bacteroidia bacterium]
MKWFTFLLVWLGVTALQAQRMPCIGIAAPVADDSLAADAGYCGLTLSTGQWVSPRTVSDSLFQAHLVTLRALRTPVYAFNLFLPGDLKVTGPDVDTAAVLAYARQVLARVHATPARLVIWGSGGSRRIPEGYHPDSARAQFVRIARQIADIARPYGITLALENLNTAECNFITTAAEALAIVRQVDHPYFRLNADLYHMLREHEGPAILRQAGPYLVHVELAEPDGRTLPCVSGTDFSPYLTVLRQLRYRRMIGIEGRWDQPAQMIQARPCLAAQIAEVYGE